MQVDSRMFRWGKKWESPYIMYENNSYLHLRVSENWYLGSAKLWVNYAFRIEDYELYSASIVLEEFLKMDIESDVLRFLHKLSPGCARNNISPRSQSALFVASNGTVVRTTIATFHRPCPSQRASINCKAIMTAAGVSGKGESLHGTIAIDIPLTNLHSLSCERRRVYN